MLTHVTVQGTVMTTWSVQYECDEQSFFSKVQTNGSKVTLLDCNTYQTHRMPENYFTAFVDENNITLNTSQNHIQYMTVNGNYVEGIRAVIADGEFAGDGLLLMTVIIADQQKGCQLDAGLHSMSVKYGFAIVYGRCSSKCTKASGYIKFAAGIHNLPKEQ